MKKTLREFLGKYFDESTIDDDDNIFETGLVNSLFTMQLVSFLEDYYDINFENEELDIENFKDINSIVALLEKKVNA
ncbi:phosphopantetheine-binding protein [Streptococcus downei]|uniref:Acyl carrier protein n=1 Tax=Streptococcus downei MFe28 TaxID=764290 RepID=A0A380JB37_STRDO|nr:phosphopantetheine-binding protein [Streptococcus downei]EFQ56945.1 hypothetical protein HMPREF9176_1028 [Streptococcus downei F0415]SUN35295.1 acyl carrier protein [Streptococcus downei MFe28]